MAEPLLNIWCDMKPTDPAFATLRQAVAPRALLPAREAPDPAGLLAQADIAFGQPDVSAVVASSRLKWVEVTSAGYTRYDRDDVRQALRARGGVLTNASGVFAEPCAEHLFAMMLAATRHLPHYWEGQRQRDWKNARRAPETRLLAGQTAVLLGFGAIARRLAELLQPLHMRLVAIRRHPRGDEPIQTVSPEQADRVLPLADHVVNTLPENPATRGLVSADWFAAMKPGAAFYNVGRGATVDQQALRANLESGHLSAAYLDVTTPEPLPADDPLWTAPNCHITPHVAGSHARMWDRLVQHFTENLTRFEAGRDLHDRVI